MRREGKNVSRKKTERISYVERQISSATLRLLEEKELEDLSILEICNEAQVARASFYRNYTSRRNIIEKHLAVLLREWGRDFEACGDKDKFFETLLNHYYSHKDTYLLLYRRGMSGMVHETIRNACRLDEAKTSIERYNKSMFAGLVFGWIDEWIRQGMPESPEEILELYSPAASGIAMQ